MDFASAHPIVEESLLKQYLLSVVRLRHRVKLVDLRLPGLHRLKLKRTDLIDTTAAEYPRTRQWALALYRTGEVEGLIWTSARDDRADAFVFYGEPTPVSESPQNHVVALVRGPLPIALPPLRQVVDKICQDTGVTVVHG